MAVFAELLIVFCVSLGFSLVLTPAVGYLGQRCGALDYPNERKVHEKPIPRIGGLAVFLAFAMTALLAKAFLPYVGGLYHCNFNTFMGHAGGILVLLCGLRDDFKRLNPWTKLIFQILAATCAFIGGAKIGGFYISGYGWSFGPVISYTLTVFWFLLFINAVNLVDGLDGLAGGLVLFTCVAMAFSTYFHGEYLSTFYFVILAAAVLGFLRYNFNPATIFLGDGGSYFLGYTLAILAIRSSTKSHVGVLMVMPLLAMGVPIFDSILSPVRRFIVGRSMFTPDREHLHHALVRRGLSTRKAVLVIYGITLAFCSLAILLMIVLRGKNMEGLMLAALLVGMLIFVRKLGYLEYLALDKIQGWFADVTDVAGISQHRRSFLSLQIEMGKSQSFEQMWEWLIKAVDMIKFDAMTLYPAGGGAREWKRPEFALHELETDREVMKLEIPLKDEGNNRFLGKIVLFKDMRKGNVNKYTIRRVEHLRRSLVGFLSKQAVEKK